MLSKQKGCCVAILFGGPLAAGYVITRNFIVFEDEEKVAITLSSAFLWAVLIILSIINYLTGAPINIINSFLFVLFLAFYQIPKLQTKDITKHIEESRGVYTWQNVAGIIIICLGIVVLSVLGLRYL